MTLGLLGVAREAGHTLLSLPPSLSLALPLSADAAVPTGDSGVAFVSLGPASVALCLEASLTQGHLGSAPHPPGQLPL